MEEMQTDATKASVSQNSCRRKSKKKKSFDFVKMKQSTNRKNLNLVIDETPQKMEMVEKSSFGELASATLHEQIYPPPMDVYVPKISV
jgi:hypothetical protein